MFSLSIDKNDAGCQNIKPAFIETNEKKLYPEKLNTFSRYDRLLTSKQFQKVFSGITKTVNTDYFVFLISKNDICRLRIGFSFSKKKIKMAHSRNRLKRIVRESFRQIKKEDCLQGYDIVIIAKEGIDKISHEKLRQLLEQSWEKLQ